MGSVAKSYMTNGYSNIRKRSSTKKLENRDRKYRSDILFPCIPLTLPHTDKKEIQISSYIGKFRVQ